MWHFFLSSLTIGSEGKECFNLSIPLLLTDVTTMVVDSCDKYVQEDPGQMAWLSRHALKSSLFEEQSNCANG